MLGCLTNEHYDLTRVCARAHVCVCSLHKNHGNRRFRIWLSTNDGSSVGVDRDGILPVSRLPARFSVPTPVNNCLYLANMISLLFDISQGTHPPEQVSRK